MTGIGVREKRESICRESIRRDDGVKLGLITSSEEGGHTQHTLLWAANEDGHRGPWPLDMDHHSGAGEEEAGHHMGPHRDDAAVGSLPSEDAGECDVHIHHVRSTLDESEWVTVHDSGPGGCILEEPGTFGHIHPWGGMVDAGNETGTDLEGDGLHGSGSGTK